jgi:hypothetical protein
MLLLSMLLLSQGAAAAAAGVAADEAPPGSGPLVKVQGLDSMDRDSAYEGMTFQTAGWQIGTVISKSPYAVVTAFDENGPIVRVWTGVIVRENNDLQTYWDQLRINSEGKVILHATDIDATIAGYFASSSQIMYRSKAYAGQSVWVDIPTDAEAEQAGAAAVKADMELRAYPKVPRLGSNAETAAAGTGGMGSNAETAAAGTGAMGSNAGAPAPGAGGTAAPGASAGDKTAAAGGAADAVVIELAATPVSSALQAAAVDVPDVIPAFRAFPEAESKPFPIDAESHWARSEIAELVNKSIIEGYEDQTIRPDRTLSKAEFVTLLVKTLGLNTGPSGKTGYIDLDEHWSMPVISAAQQFGLLDKKPAALQFEPDAAISRIEMVELAGTLLQRFGAAGAAEALPFGDTDSLPDSGKAALQAVVAAGIVRGYPDGTFRPAGSLTRAEAFKVVAALLHAL